jgi:hypothetical protein
MDASGEKLKYYFSLQEAPPEKRREAFESDCELEWMRKSQLENLKSMKVYAVFFDNEPFEGQVALNALADAGALLESIVSYTESEFG